MGSGDKHHHHHHHLNFHIHMPQINFHHNHHGKKELKDIPKGCFAVMVGQGEEQHRFVIPVSYINHPLFLHLLNEAAEKYGFDHKGPINIPCHVEEFRHIQGVIGKETAHHHHHNHWCFKA